MEKQRQCQRVAREEEEEIGDAREKQGHQELRSGSWVFRVFFFFFLKPSHLPEKSKVTENLVRVLGFFFSFFLSHFTFP